MDAPTSPIQMDVDSDDDDMNTIAPPTGGLFTVKGRLVRIFYVQAHGGGSANSSTPMISYNETISAPESLFGEKSSRSPDEIFPMKIRLVTTGQSAESNDDSDRVTAQNIVSILSKGDVYRRIKGMKPVRSEHDKKSSNIKQLLDAQVHPANTPSYPEIVSTESGPLTSVETGDGKLAHTYQADKWDQKFGIWQWDPKHGNEGWERETATHRQGQTVEAVLLDIYKTTRDVSIFRVVLELEIRYGKNIIVIFPNCSPVSPVSLTRPNIRAMSKPAQTRGDGPGTYTLQASLELLSDILRRTTIMYQGNERLLKFCKEIIDTEPLNAMNTILNFNHPIPAHPSTEKIKIGTTDSDDRQYMYQMMDSWLKEYGTWLSQGNAGDIIATGNSNLNILFHFAITSYPEVGKLAHEILGDDKKLINFAMVLLIMLYRIPPFLGGLNEQVYNTTDGEEWGGKRRMSEGLGPHCSQLWAATDAIFTQVKRLGGGEHRPVLFKRLVKQSAIMACVMDNDHPKNAIQLIRLAKAKEGAKDDHALALFKGGRKRRTKRGRKKIKTKRRRKKRKTKRNRHKSRKSKN